MSEAPERISVYPLEGTWDYGGMEFAEGDEPGLVEYVCADRIEELEAQRKKTYEAMLKVTRLHNEAEAKLAKALVAIVRIERHLTNLQPEIPQMAEGGWGWDKVIDAYVDPALAAARSAIAELEGENK